jgi:hypothetical protein
VRKRRREMGFAARDVFVPQVHAPGQTAEVDWGEADVDLAGTLTRVHLFFMRSCFSGAAFSMASPVETQQAFLEGHAHAFDWFDGVFEEVRYEYVPRHIFVVLCPTRLCGRRQRLARDHGDRRRGVAAVGHITLACPARVLPLFISREEVAHVGDVFRQAADGRSDPGVVDRS